MINYCELLYNEQDILELYTSNKWTNYTNNQESLFEGIKNSLYVYGAYLNDSLIGLIRVVGDNHTIIYVQDILVKPEYQNQLIGSTLLTHIIQKYTHVRQIVLMTDHSTKQMSFYEKNGFVKMNDIHICGYVLKK